MSLSPAQFDGRFKLLAEGDGWVAAVAVTRSTPLSSKIYVRTDGRWTDIAEVSYPAISFRGVDLEYSAGASRNLFVADGNANVFHYDVDAVAWRSVTPSTRGPARGLWGDLYNLYLLYQFGSRVEMTRFDGESWTHLPSPTFPGFSAVAGLSADEVYAISDRRLYRVDGDTPVEAAGVDCRSTPIYESLSGADGQLVLEVSCAGEHQLWRRELGDWTMITAVPDPLPGYGFFRVSRNGEVYVGGGYGAVFRVSPGGLESLEQSAAPPANALGGTAISNVFSGGDQAVAQLVDGDFQLLDGSPKYIQDLWQAPSGVLFATSEHAGKAELWRYGGASWLQERSEPFRDPFIDRPHVYGRSEDDFYFWMNHNITHWDGAEWVDVPVVPCGTGARRYVDNVTFAGSSIILARCYSEFPPDLLFEFDGTSWARLTPLQLFQIFQAGPVENPVSYLEEWEGSGPRTYRVRSESGWSSLSLPAGYYTSFLTNVDGSRFVSSDGQSFATTDGIRPWSVVSAWVTRPITPSPFGWRGWWTDGAFAGSVRPVGDEPPEGGGREWSIVICDLGTSAR